MRVTRRQFLLGSLAGIALLAVPAPLARAAALTIPFAMRLRAFLRHGPALLYSLATSGTPAISDAAIRRDYEDGRFQEIGGFYLADGEALRLLLGRRSRA